MSFETNTKAEFNTYNAECFLVQLIIFLSNWYRLTSSSDVHWTLSLLSFASWLGLKMEEVGCF